MTSIEIKLLKDRSFLYLIILETVAVCARLEECGDKHLLKSLNEVEGSDYGGEHWLASFLIHALDTRAKSN